MHNKKKKKKVEKKKDRKQTPEKRQALQFSVLFL